MYSLTTHLNNNFYHNISLKSALNILSEKAYESGKNNHNEIDNLVVLCYSKEIADKIKDLLEKDCLLEEYMEKF